MPTGNEISVLNRIRSYEMKVAAAFDQLIPSGNCHERTTWDLVTIRNDHNQAVGKLDLAIRDLGGDPGSQRTMSRREGVDAKGHGMQNRTEAIKSLMQEEEGIMEECRRAVRSGSLGPLSKTLINSEILPVLRNHVDILRQYT